MRRPRRLSTLISADELLDRRGDADPSITGIAYDSRDCRPGCVFFALRGAHLDGHRFIPQAIAAGAVAVVQSAPLSADGAPGTAVAGAEVAGTEGSTEGSIAAGQPAGEQPAGVVRMQAEDPRRLLSRVSARFYDHPARKLTVIGVTGTDGKSTTVYFLYQLLTTLGYSVGFISTVAIKTGADIHKNTMRQSTPEAPDLQSMLAEMAAHGFECAIVEATSHGLSPRTSRLADISFDVGVCTNISHDHLEFHGTPEQYRDDKANLLRALDRAEADEPAEIAGRADPAGRSAHERDAYRGANTARPRFAVLNRDDEGARSLAPHTAQPVLWYSLQDPEADLFGDELQEELDGSSFTLRAGGQSARAQLELGGRFNLENALAAALVVMRLCGRSPAEIAPLLAELKGVPGRMITVTELDHPFTVIVDYAHTPASFEKLFPMIAARTPGGIIPVFSSAGERDIEKRPILGEIAARYSRMVILADEDPRGEDPMAILQAVAEGCRRARPEWRTGDELLLIPDRPTAIRAALQAARPGDTVLLLGKGHEGNIIYADGSIAWDEEAEARKALQEYDQWQLQH